MGFSPCRTPQQQNRSVAPAPAGAPHGASSVAYFRSMKTKTSVTLSEDVVKTLDREARKGESRSSVVERLLRETLSKRVRQAADQRDRALIDRHADTLNREVEDVLRYQGDV